MSEPAGNIEGLFGSDLTPSDQHPPAEEGIYEAVGKSVTKGVFKAGRFKGRPYARFLYEFKDDDRTRMASQTLPWVPGIGFFEENFRQITGMNLQAFKQHCSEHGLDRAQSAEFFFSLFCGVHYRIQVKQDGSWLNVWKVLSRSVPAASPAAETQFDQDLTRRMEKLDMDQEDLETLVQEEWAVTFEQLSAEERSDLLHLLDEKIALKLRGEA